MKKGFTIVELLTVIAIIGIVSTVIIVGYQQITDRNYNNLYEAKIKEIESAAYKYGESNLNLIKEESSLIITVEELIAMGFVEGDSDDKNNLIDPRKNQDFIRGNILLYLDGNTLKVVFNADSIKVKLSQDTSNLATNQIKLKSTIEVPDSLSLDYCVYELNDLQGYYSTFSSGRLEGAACNNYTFDNVGYFYDIVSEKPIIAHTATLKVYDNYGREIKQSITARIKEKEIIEPLEFAAYYANGYPGVKNKYDNKWTNQNIIIVGIPRANTEYQYSLDLETWHHMPVDGYTQTQAGNNIPVYVRKVVKGVIIDELGIVMTKIDKTAPTCTHSGDSTSWTKEDRTISKGCNDTLSGCATNTINQKFTSTTTTSTIAAYTISDNAGNTRSCPARSANVYVDKTAPTCTHSGDSKEWTAGSRTISRGCKDDHSKCATSTTSQTFKTTTTTATIAAYTISDKVGNTRNCPARTANVYVDTTKPTCGNINLSGTAGKSGWYRSNVSISSSSGADSHSGIASQSLSRTSVTSETGGTVVTLTCKDKVGNTNTKTATIKIDKTKPTLRHVESCSTTFNPADPVCHKFNITDNLSPTLDVYRTHCGENPNRPEGNANWCNTTNLSAKTRVERYKAGIANPPDNKSTINKRTLSNKSFTWTMTTRLGVITHTHYGFIVCDLAGNCSRTYTFRCTPKAC